MNTTTVAVDLAKSVFELAVSDGQGRVTERKRLSKEAFRKFFANREPCRIVMEACGTAHHWARTFVGLGHEVKLLPPQRVVGRVRCAAQNHGTPPIHPRTVTRRLFDESRKAGHGACESGITVKYCRNAPNPPYGPSKTRLTGAGQDGIYRYS